MSSFARSKSRINPDQENTTKRAPKRAIQVHNENSIFQTKKSLTRASSSTLSLTRKSSANALRTKSTNSLSFKTSSDQLKQLQDRQHAGAGANDNNNSFGGVFNKARKTLPTTSTVLSDIFESDATNSVTKKLHVDRDSPLSNLNRKQKFQPSANKDLFDQLRREMALEENSNIDLDDFGIGENIRQPDEDEIEIVSKKDLEEIPYEPDNMQSMPEKLLDDIFAKNNLRSDVPFIDPLGLDLSHLDRNEATEDPLKIDLCETDAKYLSGDISGLSADLELEFPDVTEESDNVKIQKIIDSYDDNKYKPKRL